jgi:hypothetical protein
MTQASISDMVNQSREVLTKRDITTFETYENRGGLKEAIIYMAIAAVITGLLGLTGGMGGFITGILSTLIGFLVFTYLVYLIGKQFSGTGTFDQVAYTFSLFYAPLSVLFSVLTFVLVITLIGIFFVPFVGILAIIANIYFAYLAVQSSMNMRDSGKIWLTLILAGLGSWIVGGLLLGSMMR